MESQENLGNLENRESIIERKIKEHIEWAKVKFGIEKLTFEDFILDLISFAEISQNDSDAAEFSINAVAEAVGISSQEIRDYAMKKKKEYTGEE